MDPPEARLNIWGRRGVAFAWVATALLVLPVLRAGFSFDDFLQRLVLEGRAPELGLGPASLYDFGGGVLRAQDWVGRGYVPWHTDPSLDIRFFRPLGSLSIALDQALFGRAELPSHLMGIAIFLAVTALAIAFFRRVLAPNRAGLAAFLFAVASGHYLNLTWVAGRHVLVGGLFGALAVLAHVGNAEGRAPRWLPRWLAPLSLLASMLASETSLAAVALLASYELFAVDGSLGRRLLKSAPWAAAGLLYIGLYAAAGYGVKHSGLYLSPVGDPGPFLGVALTRLPTLLGELAFGVPSFLWGLAEPARPALALLGATTSALVVGLAWRACSSVAERRRVVWFSTAALLGALPMAGGVLDGRMLLIPFFVSMPLVATAIDGAFGIPGKAPRRLLRTAGGLLVFMHVVIAVLVRVGTTEVMVALAKKQRALAETADLARCGADSPLFVLTGADPSLCLSGATSLRYYRPDLAARHASFAVLSLAPHPQRLERPSAEGIVLQVVGEPRRATMFERLFRDSPLVAGQRFILDQFEALVLATEDGFFTRVAFTLPANACLLSLEHQALIGRPLPPVGTTLELPHELGPMGL